MDNILDFDLDDIDDINGNQRGSENEEESDEKGNEVRKEFTKEFKKKIAKFIPPKIKFKGNLLKRTITKEINFGEIFLSNLILFKKYIVITVENEILFYSDTRQLVFNHKFENKEILTLNNYNDETIIMGTEDKVLVINFYEKKDNQIGFEIIQQIKDTEFYCLNEKLYNGFLLLCGFDRKFAFYQIINKKEKISEKNKFQLIFKLFKVHNVYNDDSPGIVDLNNGRIFSWLNDDKNIKIIEYDSRKPRIIKSMNGYCLHNAGLICDKYIILMGLKYPEYFTWLMDTETLEIVYKWKTQENDSFMSVLWENKFLYGSDKRLGCDEFIINDGKFIRKNLFESDYINGIKEIEWEDSYCIKDFLNENTFVTINMNGKLMIFNCPNE